MDGFTNLKCILCFATWRTISHYGHVGNTRASRVMVAMRGDILAVCVSACLDYLCIGNLAWGLRLNNGSRMSREVHVRFCEGLAGKFRYADDYVMGFQHRDEAERFLSESKERFVCYGLEIHSEKTRLIEFGRFAEENRKRRGLGKPETFDFLGFTHICARTRRNNCFTIRRKTIAKRLQRKLKEVRKEIMRRRHEPVPVQGKWLRSVVQGHLNFFGVPGNQDAVDSFRTQVCRAWLFALRRRSQKGRGLTWERIKRLVLTWLPSAKVQQPYPHQRFRVSHPRYCLLYTSDA